ncbi:MAG: prephenate dehydrogenase [Gemmatimonadota bacterium]|nr:prephenate dehydrogenase [Gemmatimonadota bacterium]
MAEEIGIVGFGRCGRLAADLLSERGRVLVTDIRDLSREAESIGVEWASLDSVASRPSVVLAVPIRTIPDALEAIRPHLRDGALVVDLASVKVRPMAWMAERLPGRVAWAGTHPLFGPDTVREQGVAGQRIVVCPAPGGAETADRVVELARALGLEPTLASAEEHDRRMARSQALVFLASRALRRAGIDEVEPGTPSERRVVAALRLLEADTDVLYEDILRLNPYAPERARELRDAVEREIARLGIEG